MLYFQFLSFMRNLVRVLRAYHASAPRTEGTCRRWWGRHSGRHRTLARLPLAAHSRAPRRQLPALARHSHFNTRPNALFRPGTDECQQSNALKTCLPHLHVTAQTWLEGPQDRETPAKDVTCGAGGRWLTGKKGGGIEKDRGEVGGGMWKKGDDGGEGRGRGCPEGRIAVGTTGENMAKEEHGGGCT